MLDSSHFSAPGETGHRGPGEGSCSEPAASELSSPPREQFALSERLTDVRHLATAWEHVAAAGGAPGVDGLSISEFARDVEGRLRVLAQSLSSGAYVADALLAVRIPKHGDPGGRELLVPTVTDRVLQRAVLDAVSPACDRRLLPCAHGYRPGHSVRGAVEAVRSAVERQPWVLDADIRDFFGSVPHEHVLRTVDAEMGDPLAHRLIAAWLAAPALRSHALEPRARGLPLGSPLSPLLANLALHHLDVGLWRPDAAYVRFADDFVVCCATREQADGTRVLAGEILVSLGLALHEEKTRVIDARVESVVFLGHLIRRSDRDGRPERETPASRTLYLSEPGTRLAQRGQRLAITRDGAELLSVPLKRVREIVVLGPIEMTSGAVVACLQNGIDVSYLSTHGRWWGSLRTWNSPSPALRQAQGLATVDPRRSLVIARTVIGAKIHNQRRLLQRQAARHPAAGLREALAELDVAGSALSQTRDGKALMGVEGHAARAFFSGLAAAVDPALGFTGRRRRPPTDPVNALLSFGYTLLTNEMMSVCHQAGLDPFLGFLHQPRQGRPSLALDLIEEFRPLVVDTLVIAVLRRRVLREEHFVRESATGAVLLRDEPRAVFLREYELRMLTLFTHQPTGERVSYRRALLLQAQQVARMLRQPGLLYLPILFT